MSRPVLPRSQARSFPEHRAAPSTRRRGWVSAPLLTRVRGTCGNFCACATAWLRLSPLHPVPDLVLRRGGAHRPPSSAAGSGGARIPPNLSVSSLLQPAGVGLSVRCAPGGPTHGSSLGGADDKAERAGQGRVGAAAAAGAGRPGLPGSGREWGRGRSSPTGGGGRRGHAPPSLVRESAFPPHPGRSG